MLPYLRIFSYSIPMYSVFAVVGALLSLLIAKYLLRKTALEADGELAMIYGVIGMLVGAKLLFLLTVLPELLQELPYLRTHTQEFLQKYLYGGFVFYGGLYGALAAVWIYASVCRISFRQLMALLLPIIPLFHAMGRIGCFCMGCCYGIPSGRFGMVFAASQIAPKDVALVPVQLLEAAVELALFAMAFCAARKKADGLCTLGKYLTAYGVARFSLEFVRGDNYRGFFLGLSTSQLISIVSVLLGLYLICRSKAVPSSK